jgi:hypothetical protein
MVGMKVAQTADPTLGIRNRAPAPRWQRWSEGEAVRLVKVAWRRGYRGLACVIAVAWDTQFSPVDVRTLLERHRAAAGGTLIFDKQIDGAQRRDELELNQESPRKNPRVNWAHLNRSLAVSALQYFSPFCHPLPAIAAVASVVLPAYRKCQPIERLLYADRFCRAPEIAVVPIKSVFLACAVSHEQPYLGQ